MISTLVESANFLGTAWATWIVIATFESLVLLGVVSLLWWGLRNRVAPQVGYCLFLLVPLKLLLPIAVTLPEGWARWTPSAQVAGWMSRETAAPEKKSPINESVAKGEAPVTQVANEVARAPREQPAAEAVEVADVAADVGGFDFNGLPQPQPVSKVQTIPAPSVQETPLAAAPVAIAAESWPALQFSTVALFVWLNVVGLLLLRLVRSQVRFQRHLGNLTPVREQDLPVDVPELLARAGIHRAVRIVEGGEVTAPTVCGVFRPTLILPCGIQSCLSASQLEWVLLHELAHIRRGDLAIVVLQRLAVILNFFNPAVWVANRVADRLREYICDDQALQWSHGSAEESSEAYLLMLRQRQQGSRALDGALGFFGMDRRGECFSRLRRLLDSDRLIRTRLGGIAGVSLLLVAVLLLPSIRAADEKPAPSAAEAPAQAAEVDAKPAEDQAATFTLRVVGPKGEAVADAPVDFGKAIRAEQVVHGTLTKKMGVVQADKTGRLAIKRTSPQDPLTFYITAPGYGPYSGSWDPKGRNEPLPANFTAALGEGWSLGSLVVDEQGKPIAGADVRIITELKKRPGDRRLFSSSSSQKTDEAGRWRFDSASQTRREAYVEIRHRGYSPMHRSLSRTVYGVEAGKQPTEKITLEKGVTVIGKVTDDKGQPIANALVRSKTWDDLYQGTTDEKGEYRLEGCERGPAHVVASAAGKAIQVKLKQINQNLDRVDFTMQPGKKIRVRVVDEKDKPLPRARIFLQRWDGHHVKYFEFSHVNMQTNAQGIWEWNEAPVEEFQVDIYPEGFMSKSNQSLIARDEEYVFRHTPALEISGQVIDAETRQIVPAFSLTYGARLQKNADFYWMRNETSQEKGGRYRFKQTMSYPTYGLRIDAPGYRPAISRDIRNNEGKLELNFELQKSADLVATVLAPNGRRAIGAEATLVTGNNYVSIRNGVVERNESHEVQETDRVGKVRFPPQVQPFEMVVVHPSGYAQLSIKPEKFPETIQLLPWAKLEGTYRRGKVPTAGIVITAYRAVDRLSPPSRNIHWNFEATTDQQGHYVLDRLMGGTVRAGRLMTYTIENETGQTYQQHNPLVLTPVNVEGGKTKTLDFGGGGTVVGKLQPPADYQGQVPWKRVVVRCNTAPTLGGSLSALLGSPAPAYTYTTNVQLDGTFRIEDFVPGIYQFRVYSIPGTQLWLEPIDKEIKPEAVADAATPFDIGTLTLGTAKKLPVQKPEGKAAPAPRAALAALTPPAAPAAPPPRAVPPNADAKFLRVTLKVVDAKTRKPIPKFNVFYGSRLGNIAPGVRDDQMGWSKLKSEGKDGTYTRHVVSVFQSHAFRVESPGYRPVVTREFGKDERDATIDVEMQEAADFLVRVVNAKHLPVDGASVVLGTGQMNLQLHEAAISPHDSISLQTSNAKGEARFPAQIGPFALFITHPEGYAHVAVPAEAPTKLVRLSKWRRVEGTLRIGKKKAGAGIPITLQCFGTNPAPGMQLTLKSFEATTDAEGRFVFEQALAGAAIIGRRIDKSDAGIEITGEDDAHPGVSACSLVVPLSAEHTTTRVELGGKGRTVIGRLKAPAGKAGQNVWKFVGVYLAPNDPSPASLYQALATGKVEQAAIMNFMARIEEDGSFRIEDVPPGHYRLTTWPAGRGGRPPIGRFEVEVPVATNESDGQPVDLGTQDFLGL